MKIQFTLEATNYSYLLIMKFFCGLKFPQDANYESGVIIIVIDKFLGILGYLLLLGRRHE